MARLSVFLFSAALLDIADSKGTTPTPSKCMLILLLICKIITITSVEPLKHHIFNIFTGYHSNFGWTRRKVHEMKSA